MVEPENERSAGDTATITDLLVVPAAARQLRLVTINTAKEDQPYQYRVQLLAAGLALLDSDVVLLQETINTPDGRFNTTRVLAESLGMTPIEAPVRRKRRLIAGEVVEGAAGLGLLSRLPIVAHEALSLPTDPRDGERNALLARIDTGYGEMLLVNTHLTYLRDAAAMRWQQMATIGGHPWLARCWVAAIIGGDFNTPLPELTAVLAGLGDHWTWVDTYTTGGGREPRVTMPAYWASADDRCLDYLISISRQSMSGPRATDSAVVLTKPDAAGIYPSDHRGVMTTLHLDPAP